jgi:hypothetical protein
MARLIHSCARGILTALTLTSVVGVSSVIAQTVPPRPPLPPRYVPKPVVPPWAKSGDTCTLRPKGAIGHWVEIDGKLVCVAIQF